MGEVSVRGVQLTFLLVYKEMEDTVGCVDLGIYRSNASLTYWAGRVLPDSLGFDHLEDTSFIRIEDTSPSKRKLSNLPPREENLESRKVRRGKAKDKPSALSLLEIFINNG